MTKSAKYWWFVALIAAGLLVGIMVAMAADAPAAGTPAAGPAAHARVFGEVASVDTTNNVVTVQTRQGQVQVAVTADTQILKRTKAAASDLQVGETVMLMGRPMTMTAEQVGITPAAGQAGTQAPATQTQAPARMHRPADLVRVSGQVSKLDPLTVTMADGSEVVVTPSPKATFWQTTKVALTDVTAGQRVMVMGERAADGSIQAKTVDVSNAPVRPAKHAAAHHGHHGRA